MPTYSTGSEATTVGINMPKEMADEIRLRAQSMHLKKGTYARLVIEKWLKSGRKLTLSE